MTDFVLDGTYTAGAAAPSESLTIEKLNSLIRQLRQDPATRDLMKAAVLRAKFERLLSGPPPFDF